LELALRATLREMEALEARLKKVRREKGLE
jgi:hypothetical protein